MQFLDSSSKKQKLANEDWVHLRDYAVKISKCTLRIFPLFFSKGRYGYLSSEKGRYLNFLCTLPIRSKLTLLLMVSEHHSDLIPRTEAYTRQVTNGVLT